MSHNYSEHWGPIMIQNFLIFGVTLIPNILNSGALL